MEEIEPADRLPRPEEDTADDPAESSGADQIRSIGDVQGDLATIEVGTGSTVKEPRVEAEASAPESGTNDDGPQSQAPAEVDPLPEASSAIDQQIGNSAVAIDTTDGTTPPDKDDPITLEASSASDRPSGDGEDDAGIENDDAPTDPVGFPPIDASGNGEPPDDADRRLEGDSPEDNHRQIVEMRRELLTTVRSRLQTMPEDDDNGRFQSIAGIQTRTAETFGQIARAAAVAPEPVPPDETITTGEMFDRLPETVVNPEAAIIVNYTAREQGDADMGMELDWQLSGEQAILQRKLQENNRYLPTAHDHPLLDTAVIQFEHWLPTKPPSYHASHEAEEADLRRLVETFGASREAKWQTYLEHYARMANANNDDVYYSSRLIATARQLLTPAHPSGGEAFNDRFVLSNTRHAVESIDAVGLRRSLVANFLDLNDRYSEHPELMLNEILRMTREICADAPIPLTDRQRVIDAINVNTATSYFEDFVALDPHSKLMIQLNEAAQAKLLELELVQDDVPVRTRQLLSGFLQRAKIDIKAFAGADMDEIADDIESYNSAFTLGDVPTHAIVYLDPESVFSQLAQKFAVNGQPERAMEAIAKIQDRKIEALMACWDAAKLPEHIDEMKPATMDLRTSFRFETAKLLHGYDYDAIYDRGRHLTDRIIFKMIQGNPNYRTYDPELTLDWHQFDQTLRVLMKYSQPQARKLASIMVNYALEHDIPYTNNQLTTSYRALVESPKPEDLKIDDLRAVRRAINNDQDDPLVVTYYLANLAYHISR